MLGDPYQRNKLVSIGHALLQALGYDPADPNLARTPERWAAWWMEQLYPPDNGLDTTFDEVGTDQMVMVRGVRVWAVCEHHLLPFWCDLTMAYLPQGKILGLSKFARLARRYAAGLQVQERLVELVAANIELATRSPDVAVTAEGEHLCMLMRGVRSPHRMATSVMRGAFRTNPATREEFFHLARARS